MDLKQNIDGNECPSISPVIGDKDTSMRIIKPEHFETEIKCLRFKKISQDLNNKEENQTSSLKKETSQMNDKNEMEHKSPVIYSRPTCWVRGYKTQNPPSKWADSCKILLTKIEEKDMGKKETATHDENGKQNKSENDLKDALSVKEKNDDKEEKTINDPGTPRYSPVHHTHHPAQTHLEERTYKAGWLKMLHILSINNQKEKNSVKEFNAYSCIVYEVEANDSLEVPVALAAFVSGACLLFVVTMHSTDDMGPRKGPIRREI